MEERDMATTQNRQLDVAGTPDHKRPVLMLAQCVSLIILITSQAWAVADFAIPDGGSGPIESASTPFNVTFSAADLQYLQTGLGSNSNVVLVPLFSYQVCFSQNVSSDSLVTTIENTTWPVLRSTQSGQDYEVPIALQISGNGLSSSGSQNILFLKDDTDVAKTVQILADSVFSNNSQLNTSATFAVTAYSGKKKRFNDTSTDADDKLDHFTNGGVSHQAGRSTPATASTSQFVYNQTTLSHCTAVSGMGLTAAITITGYAYMRELSENPAGAYTLSESLQHKIHPIS